MFFQQCDWLWLRAGTTENAKKDGLQSWQISRHSLSFVTSHFIFCVPIPYGFDASLSDESH